jgi:hypothetical protein
MNILAAILQEIQNRQLDNYFQLEENVMKQTKAQMLEHIKAADKGQPLDKLRLFVIWFLSTEQDVSRQEWQQFEEALEAAGCDKTSLAYIRQYVVPCPLPPKSILLITDLSLGSKQPPR